MPTEKKIVDSPFCGCMDGDIIKDFRDMLRFMASKNGFCWYDELQKELKFDEKYTYALLQIATTAYLTEHGSSIRGSWLTDKGKQYLTQPEDYSEEYEVWSQEAYTVKDDDI